jgi:hypothetical protein
MTYHIPQRIKEGLDRYAQQGIPTGDFLRSVLENNLMQAIHRADGYSSLCLWEICEYVYNELPGNCWGSHEVVRDWLVSHQKAREEHREIKDLWERGFDELMGVPNASQDL